MAPGSLAESTLWRYSIRTIGDILVLSDIIEPSAYISLPFVNQAFFVAGCCYIKGRPYPDCMVSGLIPRRYRIATTASNSRSQPPLPPYRVIHNHPSFERTSLRRSRTRETERSLSGLTSIRLLVKHHHSEARSRDFSGPAWRGSPLLWIKGCRASMRSLSTWSARRTICSPRSRCPTRACSLRREVGGISCLSQHSRRSSTWTSVGPFLSS